MDYISDDTVYLRVSTPVNMVFFPPPFLRLGSYLRIRRASPYTSNVNPTRDIAWHINVPCHDEFRNTFIYQFLLSLVPLLAWISVRNASKMARRLCHGWKFSNYSLLFAFPLLFRGFEYFSHCVVVAPFRLCCRLVYRYIISILLFLPFFDNGVTNENVGAISLLL